MDAVALPLLQIQVPRVGHDERSASALSTATSARTTTQMRVLFPRSS
jgi:hypothetical protein